MVRGETRAGRRPIRACSAFHCYRLNVRQDSTAAHWVRQNLSDYSLDQVRAHWQRASCGEDLYLHGEEITHYADQSSERYRLEPYIPPFAEFERYRDQKVLEVGVGVGADHERFAKAGAVLHGVDLTQRAVDHTARRLRLSGLSSELSVGNAEELPFADSTFDLVYSWGVLHCSPDTQRAIREVFRVLKPGGEAKVMIYHKHSMVGYMLWLRYGLGRGRPATPLAEIYPRHLESPGTKAYTPTEARALFAGFEVERIWVELTHADLLTSPVGQQHRGRALKVARLIWPRALIRRFLPGHGLFLLIKARKPAL